MAFTDLPLDLQNIYIANIELGLKIAFFCLILWLCFRQIKNLKEKRKNEKTPYMLVAFVRSMLGLGSWGIIIVSPLVGLFLFYPGFRIDLVQMFVLHSYKVGAFVLMVIFFVNIIFFSSSILLQFAGYDANKEKNNRVLNDLEKYGGGFKVIKNRTFNLIRGFGR